MTEQFCWNRSSFHLYIFYSFYIYYYIGFLSIQSFLFSLFILFKGNVVCADFGYRLFTIYLLSLLSCVLNYSRSVLIVRYVCGSIIIICMHCVCLFAEQPCELYLWRVFSEENIARVEEARDALVAYSELKTDNSKRAKKTTKTNSAEKQYLQEID